MMDVRMTADNIARDECGNYIYIGGIEELTQRVHIAVSVPRGTFVYNRALGIDLRDLTPERETLRERLELRVREACVDIPAEVRVVSAVRAGSTLTAVLSVADGTQTMTTEVTYRGLV